ncbi:NAD(P)/FAD-dependent oxidoreductase [Pokkaliibacter sp. CJK22405]|uniref:NAD(P)/FAD-dependent oxidoreductase n=1 Tax=Pokkaliibacter sp. CJK22405 TaxID=3384615 RepID=UPI0039847BA0
MFKGVSSSPTALWEASAPPAPASAPLQGSKTTDIAIIGAGFTGMSTALHLAEAGADVCVLDAERIGYGGSGRNVGLANAGLWLEPDTMDALLGQHAGRKLYDALAKAPDLVYSLIEKHGIECEATRNGTLHLAHSSKGFAELERRHRQLIARGAPVELLDAKETEKRTGSPAYVGALFDPRAGTIQPLAYVHGLAHAALKAGAALYTQSPVTSLVKESSGWLLRTPQGEVRANKVLMATNAYTGDWQHAIQQSFVPIKYFQYASKPLTPAQRERLLPGLEGCWDTRTVMLSFRMDRAGRLVLGSMGNLLKDDGLKGWADHMCAKLFPWLGKIEWEYSWVGQIAYSEDHLPHVHQLDDNLITCLGYSGRGIGPGSLLGQRLAQYLGGDSEALPLNPVILEPISLRDGKKAFYEFGAQMTHLAQRWA